MPFDVEGALRAGYTENEVAEFMARQAGFDITGARNGGYSARDVIGFLREQEGRDSGMGWGETLRSAGKNFLPSAGRVIGEVFDAVTSPVETGKALINLGMGAAQKLIPGEQEEERYADAVVQYFRDRYMSGAENFKQTLANDPAGVLSDLASVLTGLGGAAKGGAKLAGLANKTAGTRLGQVANAVDAAGNLVDPTWLAFKGVGKTADLLYGKDMSAAQKLYQSTLKPSTRKYGMERISDMTRTALEERIPVTLGGLNVAREKARALHNQVTEKIRDADLAGRKTDPYQIAQNALESPTRKELADKVMPKDDLNAFDGGVWEYLEHHANDVSAGRAQDIKTATYRDLDKRKAFHHNAPLPAGKIAAAEELARQLRLAIENAAPEVGALNRQEGKLLDIMDAIEPAGVRTRNHNVLGLAPSLAGVMASMASGDFTLGMGTALLGSALGAPGAKSRLAFWLDDMSRRGRLPWVRGALSTLYGANRADNAHSLYFGGAQ